MKHFQAKIQKHQAFEAEVAAHSNAIVVLDNTGREMINQNHYESETIRRRLGEYKTLHIFQKYYSLFLVCYNFCK